MMPCALSRTCTFRTSLALKKIEAVGNVEKYRNSKPLPHSNIKDDWPINLMVLKGMDYERIWQDPFVKKCLGR